MLKCWRNILFITLASVLLQACATTRVTYQYQSEMSSAKRSFDAGDFKRAFCQLLPLAAKGCPEAQYALGYMYYYGYGVSEDTVSGLFWIEEAAKRHYIPAIKALKLIKQRNHQHEEPFYNKSPKRTAMNDVSDVTLAGNAAKNVIEPQNLANTSVMPAGNAAMNAIEPQNLANTTVMPAASVANEVASSQPVETQQPKPAKYTLQVFGSHELDAVKELQEKLQLQDSTYRGVTQRNGRDWYILTYGKYPAIFQAELAKDQLPKGVKELKPWIRKTDELQWVV